MSCPFRVIRTLTLATLLSAATLTAFAADKETVQTAVGAGVGGAVGAVVGGELGGRTGAIVGAATGAAIGAAVVTDSHHDHHSAERVIVVTKPNHSHHRKHCPPGHAKKGHC